MTAISNFQNPEKCNQLEELQEIHQSLGARTINFRDTVNRDYFLSIGSKMIHIWRKRNDFVISINLYGQDTNNSSTTVRTRTENVIFPVDKVVLQLAMGFLGGYLACRIPL